MRRQRNLFASQKPRAMDIHRLYGFGPRIICKMIVAESGVNVPYWTAQAWLKRMPSTGAAP